MQSALVVLGGAVAIGGLYIAEHVTQVRAARKEQNDTKLRSLVTRLKMRDCDYVEDKIWDHCWYPGLTIYPSTITNPIRRERCLACQDELLRRCPTWKRILEE